jgi:hypothetical protein
MTADEVAARMEVSDAIDIQKPPRADVVRRHEKVPDPSVPLEGVRRLHRCNAAVIEGERHG